MHQIRKGRYPDDIYEDDQCDIEVYPLQAMHPSINGPWFIELLPILPNTDFIVYCFIGVVLGNYAASQLFWH